MPDLLSDVKDGSIKRLKPHNPARRVDGAF
jgi:hypothetical protein